MKPMKFLKSEKDHFFEKTNIFEHRKPSKSKYIHFAAFVIYYNRYHQSINWCWIEILANINLEKALKLNSLDIFFKKCFFKIYRISWASRWSKNYMKNI